MSRQSDDDFSYPDDSITQIWVGRRWGTVYRIVNRRDGAETAVTIDRQDSSGDWSPVAEARSIGHARTVMGVDADTATKTLLEKL